jgi:pimeloyl-ACP methyl ester carboxylesterase
MQDLMGFVDVAGRRTRVLDIGEGHATVLLHGWGGRIESMAPVVSCLQGLGRVLAMDLIGFGEADAPDGAWGTPDHAAHVRAVLDDRGVDRASFVGHSFGARTALYIAATSPRRIDKLVAVAASGLRGSPTLSARARRLVSSVARAAGHAGAPGRKLKEALFARVASSDYREAGALRATLVRVVNEDIAHLLPLVRCPTLLVWGSEDDAVPLRHGRTMERLIPDAGLVVFEGAGHFAYLDETERFCRVVRHFLAAG